MKIHYEIVIRSEPGEYIDTENKRKFVNGHTEVVIASKKSKMNGSTIRRAIEELSMVEIIQDKRKMLELLDSGGLSYIIRLESEIYSKTNGKLGWSNEFVEKLVRKINKYKEVSYIVSNNT